MYLTPSLDCMYYVTVNTIQDLTFMFMGGPTIQGPDSNIVLLFENDLVNSNTVQPCRLKTSHG